MQGPPIGREIDGGPRDLLARITPATFAVLILLVLAGPLMTSQVAAFSGDGNPIRQVSYVLVFTALLLSTARANTLDRALAISLPINFLLLYSGLSLLWAIAPGVGARRFVLTAMIIYSVFLAVADLGVARTLRILKIILSGVLLVNFAAAILVPEIGVHQYEPGGDPLLVGDWRGIFPDKNLTGSVCAVTLLIYALDPAPWPRRIRMVLTSAALLFLALTGSKTSIGIGVVALVCGLSYRRYSIWMWPAVFSILALLVIGAGMLVYANWTWIDALLDRQDAFTGRTQIWSILFAFLGDNWLTGAGYGSFWNIGPDSPVYRYVQNDSWLTTVASSHNGYLDVAIQIGVPGLLIAIFALNVHPLVRLLIEPTRRRHGALLCALLLFCAGQNLTEATMLDRDQFIQVILIWTIAAICCRDAPAPPRGPAGSSADP